jgi:hypothetical protein
MQTTINRRSQINFYDRKQNKMQVLSRVRNFGILASVHARVKSTESRIEKETWYKILSKNIWEDINRPGRAVDRTWAGAERDSDRVSSSRIDGEDGKYTLAEIHRQTGRRFISQPRRGVTFFVDAIFCLVRRPEYYNTAITKINDVRDGPPMTVSLDTFPSRLNVAK